MRERQKEGKIKREKGSNKKRVKKHLENETKRCKTFKNEQCAGEKGEIRGKEEGAHGQMQTGKHKHAGRTTKLVSSFHSLSLRNCQLIVYRFFYSLWQLSNTCHEISCVRDVPPVNELNCSSLGLAPTMRAT